jgi:hypothetical protein
MNIGINLKRMGIALIVAAIFGLFCAYGMTTVEIPGVEITLSLLLMTFYARLLIGFVIGLSEHVKLLGREPHNSILRGAVMGGIVSIVVSFYGGGEVMISFGIIYGIITDFLATRFGS